MNFIHPDDRRALAAQWKICREQERVYHNTFRMVATDGQVVRMTATVTPAPANTHPPKRWIGVIKNLGPGDQDGEES